MSLSENTKNGIVAAFALFSLVLLLVSVPHELLKPVAIVGFAVGVLGVVGTRRYLQRLHRLVALASREADSERTLQVLRARQSFLPSVGLAFGVVALVSFLVLAYLYDL